MMSGRACHAGRAQFLRGSAALFAVKLCFTEDATNICGYAAAF
jgi:hypothetical protein